MATPLKSANTVDFNQTRNDQPGTTHDGSSYSRLRYRMVSLLQNSLDLRELLQLFHDELSKNIRTDGLRYVHEARQVQQLLGHQATHSCGYRLITQRDHLGEIIFYNSARFSEEELLIIETLLSTIICPLRNALQDEPQGTATDRRLVSPLATP